MLLTLRTTNTHGNARSTADAIITALSPAAWYRNATDVVSSGGFASIWADYASSDKGLVLPGVAGNYASAPDSAQTSLTGDMEIAIRVALNDFTSGANQQLVYKYSGGGNGFAFVLIGTGSLTFVSGGTNNISVNSTTAVGTDGAAIWLRVTCDVDNGAAGSTVRFWSAADSVSVPTSWTQVGTDKTTAGVHSRTDSGGATYIGGNSADGSSGTNGRIYRAIVKDGIDGTTVFDADFSAQAIGAGSFTESSSNAATVTINASGAAPAHIGKARDLLQGTGTNQPAYAAGVFTFDGADNFMAASYTANQPRTRYIAGKQATWTNGDHIINGVTANVAIYQDTATPRLSLYAGSGVVAANTDLAVNTLGILCVVFNGASSSLRVNNNTKTTGNAGANNTGGLTLAAVNGGASGWGNLVVYEVIDFAAAHSDAEQDSVITALNNALGMF